MGNGARWADADGESIDLTRLLVRTHKNVNIIDRPIWMAIAGGRRVAVRLVAQRKPHEATAKSLEKVLAEAARRNTTPQPGTIIAAEWLIRHLARQGRVSSDGHRRSLPAALAHRDRLQAFEKRRRIVPAARA